MALHHSHPVTAESDGRTVAACSFCAGRPRADSGPETHSEGRDPSLSAPHTHIHAQSSAHTSDPSSNVISEDFHDADIFEESCVESVVEGVCDFRQSRSEVIVPSGYGVTGLGKAKGTGSAVVGVGGSEIGGSGGGIDGHGGIERAEVDVDVTSDSVGFGGKSGFGGSFGGHLDIPEVGGNAIDMSRLV